MNQLATQQTGGALSTGTDNYDPFSAYAKMAGADRRPMLKYNKGDWLLGQDAREIPQGTRLIVSVPGLEIGWIKWWDKRPVDRLTGLLVDGFKPATRDSLGDLDQALWQSTKNQKTGAEEPQDPWQYSNTLPALFEGEEIVITMSSKGGTGAVAQLCAAYGKEYRQRPGMAPVVELGTGTYDHKDYGRTKFPILKLVDWVPEPGTAEDPEAPAAPEAKPTAATGKKTATKF